MLISRNREKLINVVVYFASNTRHCGKVKLFKLLYLLDFTHFRETGRSVTGLDYRAWKMGPVPLELMKSEGPGTRSGTAAGGDNERIPYTLAVPDSDPNRDVILEAAREYEGVFAAAPHEQLMPPRGGA
jgi:Antitoxin SocA-like, Panacea domain